MKGTWFNKHYSAGLLFFAVCMTGPACTPASGSFVDDVLAEIHKLESSLVRVFQPKPVDYDHRMIVASQIAMKRAHPETTWRCWHCVKDALLDARVISSRPKSCWANQAGDELCASYGFTKLKIRNPRKAPVGAVIVYDGNDGGHVELRTPSGFVSDFISDKPYPRRVIGVYVKPSSS